MQETTTDMRALWLVVAVVAVVLAFFAAIHWCHLYVIEEFDDKDVPHMFKMGRRQQVSFEEDGDDFDHMADPKEPTSSLEPTEIGLDTWEGGIALALYDQRPDLFAKIQEWYESDTAYDLEGLDKALVIEERDKLVAWRK